MASDLDALNALVDEALSGGPLHPDRARVLREYQEEREDESTEPETPATPETPTTKTGAKSGAGKGT